MTQEEQTRVNINVPGSMRAWEGEEARVCVCGFLGEFGRIMGRAASSS